MRARLDTGVIGEDGYSTACHRRACRLTSRGTVVERHGRTLHLRRGDHVVQCALFEERQNLVTPPESLTIRPQRFRPLDVIFDPRLVYFPTGRENLVRVEK